MDKAVARIETALLQNENILVYGDYDVDGTTAVALMSSYLKTRTDRIATYIPDRYDEGYGISYKGIDFAGMTCEGIVLSPNIFKYYFEVADPLFDEEEFNKKYRSDTPALKKGECDTSLVPVSIEVTKGELLNRLQRIRDKTLERQQDLEKRAADQS